MNNTKKTILFKYLISSSGECKIGWINKRSKKQKKLALVPGLLSTLFLTPLLKKNILEYEKYLWIITFLLSFGGDFCSIGKKENIFISLDRIWAKYVIPIYLLKKIREKKDLSYLILFNRTLIFFILSSYFAYSENLNGWVLCHSMWHILGAQVAYKITGDR